MSSISSCGRRRRKSRRHLRLVRALRFRRPCPSCGSFGCMGRCARGFKSSVPRYRRVNHRAYWPFTSAAFHRFETVAVSRPHVEDETPRAGIDPVPTSAAGTHAPAVGFEGVIVFPVISNRSTGRRHGAEIRLQTDLCANRDGPPQRGRDGDLLPCAFGVASFQRRRRSGRRTPRCRPYCPSDPRLRRPTAVRSGLVSAARRRQLPSCRDSPSPRYRTPHCDLGAVARGRACAPPRGARSSRTAVRISMSAYFVSSRSSYIY